MGIEDVLEIFMWGFKGERKLPLIQRTAGGARKVFHG